MRTAWICALAVAGCTASSEDVRPPPDQLSFPTGIAASPDEKVLFVTNANSELRYDSGSIGVIDLVLVQQVIADWTASQTGPAGCDRDPEHSETLVCDEAQFFKRDAGVRVGNFATDLTVQAFAGGQLRVFVPTRGDPSIAWADYEGDRLRCTSGDDVYALCDDAHRLTALDNDPDLVGLPAEPFAVYADAPHGFAMVSHLNTGAVTLINAPADSSQVKIVDVIGNLFAGSLATGLRAASTIAGRSPDGPDNLVYVASSSENRIQTLAVGKLQNAAAYLLQGTFFFLESVGSGAGNSQDTRSIRFSPSGDRLYVANRAPPSLQVLDTSTGPTGVPRNAQLGSSDICREASTLTVADAGAGERAFVTCFQDGQVYVVDPTGQSQVEDIISVGRGPYGAVALTGGLDDTTRIPKRPQLVVSNFLEDTLAVIDLSPVSDPQTSKRNRVVLRIGKPRAP